MASSSLESTRNEKLTAQLRFVEGDSKVCQRVIDLLESNVKIGRGQDCDIIWASMMISREHANLEYFLNEWYIRNISRNGVFVNGALLTRGELFKLSNDDLICFSPPAIEGTMELAKYKFRLVTPTVLEPLDATAPTEMNDGATPGNEDTNVMNPDPILEIMNDEMACAVCSDVFIEATTIDCGHNFCKYCINQWTQTQGSNHRNCPICRKPIQLMTKNVEVNNFLNRMYDRFPASIKNERERIIAERQEILAKKSCEPSTSAAAPAASSATMNNIMTGLNHQLQYLRARAAAIQQFQQNRNTAATSSSNPQRATRASTRVPRPNRRLLTETIELVSDDSDSDN